MRVAVVGGGAIGGYLSALLTDAGHDVTLCVRTPFDRLVVEDGAAERTVPVTILSDPGALAPVEWLVLAVKAQDTAGAAGWLRALAPGGTLVVAQNGVGHEARVAPWSAGATVVPSLIYFTIEPVEPGRIRHSTGNRMILPASPGGRAFAALLAEVGVEVELTDDFLTATWRKLLGNAVMNPLTALTGRRSGVFADPDIEPLGRTLLEETLAVGAAAGARFAADELERSLEAFRAIPPENGTSMLFDRLAGRPLEHEHITGAVVAGGRRHGIPTPASDIVLALLAALDRGLREPR